MAIALDNAARVIESLNTGSDSGTYTITSNTNGVLIALVVLDYSVVGDTLTGITYDGVAMNLVVKKSGAFDTDYLYYLLNPPTGTKTLAITYGTTGSPVAFVLASSYTGVAQSGQPDSISNGAVTLATTLTVTTTVVADNSWVVGGCSIALGAGGGHINAGTGVTSRATSATGPFRMIADSNGAQGAGNYSMTYNQSAASNDDFVALIASLKPATTTTHLLTLMGAGV